MSETREAVGILRRTAEFFMRDPDIWGRGEFCIKDTAEEPMQYCMMGALGMIGVDDPYYFGKAHEYPCESLDAANNAILDAISNGDAFALVSVTAWNDNFADNVDDVIDILHIAASNLENK